MMRLLWYLVKDFRPEDAAPVSPGCVPEQMAEAVLNDEIVVSGKGFQTKG